MDVPGMDDLLDLSNDDIFSSSTATAAHLDLHCHASSTAIAATATGCFDAPTANYYNFPDVFCVHSDEVAELEWLSNYMDDSITDCPANSITSAAAAFHGSFRRTNSAAAGTNRWSSTLPPNNNVNQRGSLINSSKENAEKGRRCTHCSSEKTPQWRTGPMGPKTLCNACGVRYKSGRLVPEYRPAASPTFVLTQHSNSHRKVLELRRQKELLHQQQFQSQRCNDITFRTDDVM
ncbi:GATA transcription factor 4-like [Olea europaea var. sylvestris]|uniref:GATA transcription factor 4-like n=1 Tax=Olea europaea var. sylvestris TaxID=158386 RepID=UPI000C1D8B56|nr:GATA transcription factor 4-like [Olea europaea var. sylvestris]